MSLSPKQIQSFQQATKRFNIWVGAVRSGKTYASILKLVDLLKYGPPGNGMIIGVNRDTIQRNVLLELYKFLGWPPPGTKLQRLNYMVVIFTSSVRMMKGRYDAYKARLWHLPTLMRQHAFPNLSGKCFSRG